MTVKSSTTVQVIESLAALKNWRYQLEQTRGSDKRPLLGFVPTMGALHEGHMSLVKQAVEECRHVIVSIFVNPLQFGPNEDFDKYPRVFEKDLQMCRQAGVEAVFHPPVQEMYPQGQKDLTKVIPPAVLIQHLCGAFRPGHFEGVATVVAKLFGMVEADCAYFGQKDYQQLAVIRRMVLDLDIPVKVVGVPTARENDGLAMSSRNVYLTPEQRLLAPVLYQTLCEVKDQALSGAVPLPQALEVGRQKLSALPGVEVQYLDACHPQSLAPLTQAAHEMVVLVAVKLGSVRLIDNIIVGA